MTAAPLAIVDDAIRIWQTGLDAVLGDRLVRSQVKWDGNSLTVLGQKFDLSSSDRIVIVGAGKATWSMCQGLVRVLEAFPTKSTSGWINVPEFDQCDFAKLPVHVHMARPHGINEPTKQAEFGANKILELVSSCSPADTVICLLSGGGSALLPAPREGITLEGKLQVTKFLSGAGCTIQELNIVRRSLSRIKAGGLARACNAAKLITLVLSDVLGDPLEFIASGPTELQHPPDSKAALQVIRTTDPSRKNIPTHVFELLENDVASGTSSKTEPPRAEIHNIILGNNETAVQASVQQANSLHYASQSFSSRQSEGDVQQLAKYFATSILNSLKSGEPAALVHGGEPTVTLPDPANRGIGGRNQQLALCVLRELVAAPHNTIPPEFVFLSAGTDGEDGPTQAAGAWIDSQLLHEMANRLPEIDSYIARCDAFHFFDKHKRLLITGPTGTNVCDVRVVLVTGPKKVSRVKPLRHEED
jgi:glycerate 2-kinase